MAFKKFMPRAREPIRRKACPFCDRHEYMSYGKPDAIKADVDGVSVPFSMMTYISCESLVMRVEAPFMRMTVPIVREPLLADLADPNAPFHPGVEYRVVYPKTVAIAVPIGFCPMCGRRLHGSRQRVWGKA